MSFCSRCGVTLSEGAAVCPSCGQSTAGTSAATLTGTLPGGVPPVTPEKTSRMAIASLVCSLVFCLGIPSILAVIFGHLSLSEIKKSAGRLGGKGIATAGLVLGYVGVAFIPLALIIAAIAIPNLLRARMAANESSAMSAIRTLNVAELSYSSAHDGGFTCSLAELQQDNLIDPALASGRKNGYVLGLRDCVPEKPDGPNTKYHVIAYPETKDTTGRRAFCSDESAVVRVDATGDGQKCIESGSPL